MGNKEFIVYLHIASRSIAVYEVNEDLWRINLQRPDLDIAEFVRKDYFNRRTTFKVGNFFDCGDTSINWRKTFIVADPSIIQQRHSQ